VETNSTHQAEATPLPPMKFVCELPASSNPVASFSWSDSVLELTHLGPILDKFLQELPYTFQAEAITKIIHGSDLIISAGTGSGKTEIFLFAMIELLLQGKISGAIIFYPSKQLVQDQEARLTKYLSWIAKEHGKIITYSSYTGDLSAQAINGIERACPDILLATFDKVFHRIVRNRNSASANFPDSSCDNSQQFFSHLISRNVVVFDEIHVYSGLMLSNIYNYVQFHKAVNQNCRVILSSATISEVESFRNSFLPSAEIISGNPRRGVIQILTMEKQYLDQLNNYIKTNFLTPGNSINKKRRVILFNDNISENESFTFQVKQQMADKTGIEIERITEYEQNKIACIHSQLAPERKQDITQMARDNQLFYIISTDLLAQGVDFPGFYFGIQIGWPITGLTGALQRIGRIRFEDDLNEVRYFIFVFDPENEKDGYYLAFPHKLAEQLLDSKLPPLLFSRDNLRIIQGAILLATAYGITHVDELTNICCNSMPKKASKQIINDKIRQVITFLVANGILAITDNEISIGSDVELALFLRDYSLRAIPPKWTVKNEKDECSLFTIDSRKVIKEALPGNLLINDSRFWLVKRIEQRRKEVFVEAIKEQHHSIDLTRLEKNKCFSPEFSIGRFAQEISLEKTKILFGDLQITRKPSIINSFSPAIGFAPINLDSANFNNPLSNITFSTQSAGLVISFHQNILKDLLKHLSKEQFRFLRLITQVLLLEASRELNISRKEVVNSISWNKGKEAIAIYDLAGPNGNSQKIFLHIEQLLKSIQNKLINCNCSTGCSACFGDLTKIFRYNPKMFLVKWLESVLT